MKREVINRNPLHRQAAEWLRSEIVPRCAPGQRLEAEDKLAARFRVSVRTIREALSVLAQEGLIERRHGSGTYIADYRSRQHVALWFGIDPLYPRADHLHRVLGLIHASLKEQGVPAKTYFVYQTGSDLAGDVGCEELLENLAKHRVSAVALLNGPLAPEVLAQMRQLGVPCVHQASGPSPIEASVGGDQRDMVLDGTCRLLEQGSRRIALMAWLDPRGDNLRNQKLIAAFRELLGQHGVEFRPEWVRGDLHPTLMGAGYEEFREIWASHAEKPDGLLVADDVLFQDVVAAIMELGIRVPEQLKVVAHANTGAVTCPFFPSARMAFDPAEQAEAITERLLKLVRREPIAQPHMVLRHRWIELRHRWIEEPSPKMLARSV